MILIKQPLALAVMAAAVLSPALASENPGAHVHGQASMQIALEGKRIDVIFETPAANLVGFEYEPKTGAEHKAVAEARQWLKSTPLVNTAASTCRVEQAAVSAFHDNNEGHHDEHHHSDHHEHERHQEVGESHSEFEVSQLLVCDSAPAENVVTLLLTQYPAITGLSIDWVSENGQGNTRLEAGETLVQLSR